MNKLNGYIADEQFFGAANSFLGFKSLFPKLFNPSEYERIYIIKGGPGTGKSSMMKSIIKSAKEKGIYTRAVYCSSDPYSLDGVILENADRSVAVLDGTAPHMTDPQYPGAVEEIINLEESFNLEKLRSKKTEIISLALRKKQAYSDAYSYLSIAGEIFAFLNEKMLKYIDYCRAESLINEILDTYKSDKRYENCRKIYISSFGKYGYKRLDTDNFPARKKVRISGNGYTEYALINLLSEKLKAEQKALILCPYPLDSKLIEAVVSDKYIFMSSTDKDSEIDSSVILSDTPDLKKGEELYQSALSLSSDAFTRASNHHFELEAIYSSAMDFKNNDRILSTLTDKIFSDLGYGK